jgi:hypothetical protein
MVNCGFNEYHWKKRAVDSLPAAFRICSAACTWLSVFWGPACGFRCHFFHHLPFWIAWLCAAIFLWTLSVGVVLHKRMAQDSFSWFMFVGAGFFASTQFKNIASNPDTWFGTYTATAFCGLLSSLYGASSILERRKADQDAEEDVAPDKQRYDGIYTELKTEMVPNKKMAEIDEKTRQWLGIVLEFRAGSTLSKVGPVPWLRAIQVQVQHFFALL